MRIATWNVERLKHRRSLCDILLACEQARADILILTETDEQVRPSSFRYCFQTPKLMEIAPVYYKPTENRVSILTNYKCVSEHITYDKYTALCVELETELGYLCVYGTIMGIEGNRRPSFKADLQKQLEDFARLTAAGKKLCIAGDYNISFSDNYYFTNFGRNTLTQLFSENHIRLLTQDAPECIDHIAVSDKFVNGMSVSLEEWNIEKNLSDHKGIVATIHLQK